MVILRTVFMAGLALLILVPLWASGGAMDRAVGMRAGSLDGHARLAHQITLRLDALRQEIAADMCRRDTQPICLAGMCVPLSGPACPEG